MLTARIFPVLVALPLLACNSAEDKAKEADQARLEAERKVAEATQDTKQKEAEAQRKADAEKGRIAAEGARKLDDANDQANQKIDAAAVALVKARADVRDSTSKKLEDLDKQVVELRTKLDSKLPKATVETIERNLKAQSDSVRKSISDLDTTSADGIDSMKKTIEARLADYDKAIADAKKRV